MNTSSTLTTAILRGLYVAVVTGLIAGLTAYQQTDQAKASIITGSLAFLGALGVRGAFEGMIDSARQANGNVSPSDVQPSGSGNP